MITITDSNAPANSVNVESGGFAANANAAAAALVEAEKSNTGAKIKALYEAESDTNAFTDDEKASSPLVTRAELVTWAASNTPVNGREYRAAGLSYIGVTSSTAISDLPGLEPNGTASLAHWAVPATGSHTLMQAAMVWCITNSRALVDSGSYEIGATVTAPFVGDLKFDLTGASISTAAGFPGSGAKGFSIVGGTQSNATFDWIGGHYNGETMPAEGTLSSNDFFNISTDESASLLNFHPESAYMGADWRTSGGDSFALINADRVNASVGHCQGAQDLGIYITSSSSSGVARQEMIRVRGNFVRCRYGAAAKRQTGLVDMRISATDCIIGGSIEGAEVGAGVPDIGVDTSIIEVIAKRCEHPARAFLGYRGVLNVVASDNGIRLEESSIGAGDAYTSNHSSVEIVGGTYMSGSISSHGINPGVVSNSYGGGASTDFAAIQFREGTAASGAVQAKFNNFFVTADGLGRVVLEQSTSNKNHVVYNTDIAASTAVVGVGPASVFTKQGETLTLLANNNAGPALNVLTLRDTDGSATIGQAAGRIDFTTSDTSSAGIAASMQAIAQNATGSYEMVISAGVGGGVLKAVSLKSSGNFHIDTNGAAIVLANGSGTLFKLEAPVAAGPATWVAV